MLFAVFDVESVGLYGEGFAVGAVLIDDRGHVYDDSLYSACHPEFADGDRAGRMWLELNLPPLVYTRSKPAQVREDFWIWWMRCRKLGALLAADVPWPVDARFLHQCISDDVRERNDQGPYPLIDVASVRLAAGLDPLATEPRLGDELPIHNPLSDAMQSGRLLVEALERIRRDGMPTAAPSVEVAP